MARGASPRVSTRRVEFGGVITRSAGQLSVTRLVLLRERDVVPRVKPEVVAGPASWNGRIGIAFRSERPRLTATLRSGGPYGFHVDFLRIGSTGAIDGYASSVSSEMTSGRSVGGTTRAGGSLRHSSKIEFGDLPKHGQSSLGS